MPSVSAFTTRLGIPAPPVVRLVIESRDGRFLARLHPRPRMPAQGDRATAADMLPPAVLDRLRTRQPQGIRQS